MNQSAESELTKRETEHAQLWEAVKSFSGDTESETFRAKTERLRVLTEEIEKIKNQL